MPHSKSNKEKVEGKDGAVRHRERGVIKNEGMCLQPDGGPAPGIRDELLIVPSKIKKSNTENKDGMFNCEVYKIQNKPFFVKDFLTSFGIHQAVFTETSLRR